MIRVYVLRVERLMNQSFSDLVDSLPFGEKEKKRLLSINNSKRKWESLGSLVALWRLMSECGHPFYEIPAVISRAPSGKPYFDSPIAPHFSISHSSGIAAAAMVDRKYGEIGFDIEVIDNKYDFRQIADRYFTDSEKKDFDDAKNSAEAFYAVWTAKEAKAKLGGAGLASIIGRNTAPQKSFLSRFYMDIEDRKAVLSVCSYVAEQAIQIYTDKEVTL